MFIRQNTEVPTITSPGLVHQTLAGPRDGVKTMEMWLQTLAPGAGTPMHRHDCEEVIVVLSGAGMCEIDSVLRPFGPGATIFIPPNVVHRISNSGHEELRLVAALGAAPVIARTPEGTRLPLPWDQAA